jgi:hypothetical protein
MKLQIRKLQTGKYAWTGHTSYIIDSIVDDYVHPLLCVLVGCDIIDGELLHLFGHFVWKSDVLVAVLVT